MNEPCADFVVGDVIAHVRASTRDSDRTANSLHYTIDCVLQTTLCFAIKVPVDGNQFMTLRIFNPANQ